MSRINSALLLGLGVAAGGCGFSGDAFNTAQPETNETAAAGEGGSAGYGAAGNSYGDGYGSYYGAGEIRFLDDVQSNIDLAGSGVASISFVDVDGNARPLESFYRNGDVVLVITRGNTNPICPYCSTQTSQLISNYQKFRDRGTEVVLVYPIEAAADQPRLDAFLQDARSRLSDPAQQVPFPVLVDPGLAGVERLGIRADLARPATYIVDRNGDVRFGYVGADLTDRPSVESLLAHLDELHPQSGPGATPDITPLRDSGEEAGATDPSAPSESVSVPAADS